MPSFRANAFLVLSAALSFACGGGSEPPTGGSPPPEPPPQVPGPPPLPCPSPDNSASRTTYYVAANEPGADNERCNGLSPTNAGGGNCPFRDFESARTFRLLRDAPGVRVEVRAGTYRIANEALTVSGTGTGGRVVLTAYRDESVVFDGGSVVREIVRLSGVGATVERVTFQNAGAHSVEVRGGSDHIVQCSRFLQNRSSDSLKGDEGASGTIVRDNEFSGWDSQAIDLTGVSGWSIVANRFRDPAGVKANAVGAKLGARDVLIARNRFENTGGLAFGGVSSAHGSAYEAFALVAERNTFENLEGPVVKFYSCSGCAVRDNDISGAGGGFDLGGEAVDGPSGCPGGCRATTGAVVTGNRLRRLRGGTEGGPDTFWSVSATDASGLSAGQNLYCVTAGGQPKFLFDGASLNFAEWRGRTGTDETSRTALESDSACTAW